MRRLTVRLHRLWSAYWHHKARRAAVVVLPLLDDRTLRDIGLTRGDVDSVVFGSRADRMRAYHVCWQDGARSAGERSAAFTRP